MNLDLLGFVPIVYLKKLFKMKTLKTCINCKREFISKQSNTINCSKECSKKYWNKFRIEYNKKNLKKNICLNCKKEYLGFGKFYCSQTCSYASSIRNNKISLNKQNDKNPMWKGNSVKYHALHGWVNRKKIKPPFCEECNKEPPYDLANISGEYKRDINDYKWLCRRCHMKSDNRLYKFIELSKHRPKKTRIWNTQEYRDKKREYCHRPEVRQRLIEYSKKPEVLLKRRENRKRYYLK
jgi:hypothetical protein